MVDARIMPKGCFEIVTIITDIRDNVLRHFFMCSIAESEREFVSASFF